MYSSFAEMPAAEVVFLYKKLQENGIKIWIDGGWGVDALLEKQTRLHQDLDIVIQEKDLSRFSEIIEGYGYQNDLEDKEATPWNYTVKSVKGYKIDIHAIVFNKPGDGLYGSIERGLFYPAASLLGKGKIENFFVQCITPEYMVQFHTGYQLRETDFKDVQVLCKKFDLPYPDEYKFLE